MTHEDPASESSAPDVCREADVRCSQADTRPRPAQAVLSADMFRQVRPCADCPFLKQGGIRHGVRSVLAYAIYFLGWPGVTFPCHNTRPKDGTHEQWSQWRAGQTLCVGGLILAEKYSRRNAVMRMGLERGWYDPGALRGYAAVVDTVEELLDLNAEEGQ